MFIYVPHLTPHIPPAACFSSHMFRFCHITGGQMDEEILQGTQTHQNRSFHSCNFQLCATCGATADVNFRAGRRCHLMCQFVRWNLGIPSLKLTYPLKIDPWKRRFLLETIIFRGYVSGRVVLRMFLGSSDNIRFCVGILAPRETSTPSHIGKSRGLKVDGVPLVLHDRGRWNTAISK